MLKTDEGLLIRSLKSESNMPRAGKDQHNCSKKKAKVAAHQFRSTCVEEATKKAEEQESKKAVEEIQKVMEGEAKKAMPNNGIYHIGNLFWITEPWKTRANGMIASGFLDKVPHVGKGEVMPSTRKLFQEVFDGYCDVIRLGLTLCSKTVAHAEMEQVVNTVFDHPWHKLSKDVNNQGYDVEHFIQTFGGKASVDKNKAFRGYMSRIHKFMTEAPIKVRC